MKKVLLSAIVFLTSVMIASAQVNAPKETPQLFEGPAIKGTIINGGADYQLANKALNRTELEAIYSIKTDDGVYIHVRNRGIIWNGKDANGNPSFYFKAAPLFEAPADSKYAWLNNSLFVCAPDFTQQFKGIVLNVWKVK